MDDRLRKTLHEGGVRNLIVFSSTLASDQPKMWYSSARKYDQQIMRIEKLTLRLTGAEKKTLQDAARAECKSLSKYVLDAALSEAEERLPDRRVFTLDNKAWNKFVSALDAPPRRHSRLEQLFFKSRAP